MLVGGGVGADGGILASAEVFDPASGSFSPVGAMTTPQEDVKAVSLLDGRVVLVCGWTSEDRVTAKPVGTSEFYDPSRRSFTAGPSFVAPRSGCGAAQLPDGGVLVVGGYKGDSDLSSAEAFSP